jgi:membrane protein required for colicin V production
MNWLDIVILVVLIAPIFIGLKLGLIKAAFSLAGLIIGVVLASNFYDSLAGVMTFITNEGIANIVAFAIILVVVMVIAAVLARVLKTFIKFVFLGWVDHVGGAVLGLVMGALLISAVLATLVKYYGTGLITDSLLAGFLLDKFPLILGLLPEDFNSIRDFFQQ